MDEFDEARKSHIRQGEYLNLSSELRGAAYFQRTLTRRVKGINTRDRCTNDR